MGLTQCRERKLIIILVEFTKDEYHPCLVDLEVQRNVFNGVKMILVASNKHYLSQKCMVF